MEERVKKQKALHFLELTLGVDDLRHPAAGQGLDHVI